MWRTVRWLDRCIEFHQSSGKDDVQNLFAIVQGGLDPDLRDQCLDEMIARKDKVAGYAIGGLSGGEEKGVYETSSGELEYSSRFRRDILASVSNSSSLTVTFTYLIPRIKQCADKLPEDSTSS